MASATSVRVMPSGSAHAGQVAGRRLKLLDGGVFNTDAAVFEHHNVGVRNGNSQ
jgi:hypothetical protein